jgi:hypothetical protein
MTTASATPINANLAKVLVVLRRCSEAFSGTLGAFDIFKEENLLSTVDHYDEQGDEKNHDPAYRSQPEQPFLDPQSPFYLR